MFNVKNVIDKINTGVAIIDRTKKVLFWNLELRRMSGISKEDALGKKIDEICPKFREKIYCDIIENLFSTGQSRFCSSQLHKAFISDPDGGEVYQNMKADPVVENGKVRFAVLQFFDVTNSILSRNNLRKIIAELRSGLEKIRESKEAAQKEAQCDMLTGLLNRHGLENEMANIVKNAKPDESFAVFFIDIDKFKNINDTYGHLVGDVLLQQFAGRLLNYTRQSKGRNKDLLARIGGDEFIIVMAEIKRDGSVSAVADKIITAISKPFNIDKYRIDVSASLGIAVFPEHGKDLKTLVDRADKAMYCVKKAGGGDYKFHK